MANHGGARKGAGRPPKADELKLKQMFSRLINDEEVIKRINKIIVEGNDSDSLKAIQLYLDRRWGKVKESVDITSDGNLISFKDMIRFGE